MSEQTTGIRWGRILVVIGLLAAGLMAANAAGSNEGTSSRFDWLGNGAAAPTTRNTDDPQHDENYRWVQVDLTSQATFNARVNLVKVENETLAVGAAWSRGRWVKIGTTVTAVMFRIEGHGAGICTISQSDKQVARTNPDDAMGDAPACAWVVTPEPGR